MRACPQIRDITSGEKRCYPGNKVFVLGIHANKKLRLKVGHKQSNSVINKFMKCN